MIKKSIKSTIFVLLILGTFTGLAAAVDDIELETQNDLPNERNQIPSNSFVDFPYGASDVYHANIDTRSDIDWVKAGVNAGDYIDILVDTDAYNAYIYYRAENPDGSLVLQYGKKTNFSARGSLTASPVYVKFGNHNLVPYNDYQFFALRRTT